VSPTIPFLLKSLALSSSFIASLGARSSWHWKGFQERAVPTSSVSFGAFKVPQHINSCIILVGKRFKIFKGGENRG